MIRRQFPAYLKTYGKRSLVITSFQIIGEFCVTFIEMPHLTVSLKKVGKSRKGIGIFVCLQYDGYGMVERKPKRNLHIIISWKA